MIRKILLLFIFQFANLQAQSYKENADVEAGYVYFNGSFLKLGTNYFLSSSFTSFGAHVNLAFLNNNIIIVPELVVTQFLSNEDRTTFNNANLIFTELGISPNTITPKLGWSYGTVFHVATGYGIAMRDAKNYRTEGLYINVGIAIPLGLRLHL